MEQLKTGNRPAHPTVYIAKTKDEFLSALRAWMMTDIEQHLPTTIRFDIGHNYEVEVNAHEDNYSIEYLAEEIGENGIGGEDNEMYTFETLEDMAAFAFAEPAEGKEHPLPSKRDRRCYSCKTAECDVKGDLNKNLCTECYYDAANKWDNNPSLYESTPELLRAVLDTLERLAALHKREPIHARKYFGAVFAKRLKEAVFNATRKDVELAINDKHGKTT